MTALNPRLRTVLLFGLACAIGFGYLWVKAGGGIPLVAPHESYKVSFDTKDIKNLRDMGEVRIAGVSVGHVLSSNLQDGTTHVTLGLDSEAVPLHQGARFRIGVKSLVGSSFVEVVDGKGPAIASGTTVPTSSVTPAVDVDELFDTLDPTTRAHLSSALQSLGKGVQGRGADIDDTLTGLGHVGREGRTALDALAAQSGDLRKLTAEATSLIDALDTGNGEIVGLVSDAQRLTRVTASNQAKVQQTVRLLPNLVGNLDTAAVSLDQLSQPLAPIAHDLRAASPYLSNALVDLRPTTRDLRGLLPALYGVLQTAPATLSQVPAFGGTVHDLAPDLGTTLSDVSPMLAYLAPYGLDLGALFGSFGGSFDTVAEDGIIPIRLTATSEGLGTIRGNPIPLVRNDKPGTLWNNPYPKAGTVDKPGVNPAPYPHVDASK